MSINGCDPERHFVTAHGASNVPTLVDDIRQVFAAFATRWLLISVSIGIFLAGGILVMWTAEPVYQSTVEILVDPRVLQLVEKEVVPTGLGSSSEGADIALVVSQLEILKSKSVVSELIAQEDLENNSEFSGGGSSGGVVGLLKTLFYGPNLKSYNGKSNFDQVLENVYEAMAVDRVGDSYIIGITFKTADPTLSSRLANAVADIYISQWAETNATSTEEVAVLLEQRLEILGALAEKSQQAVEDYRRENGLISSQSAVVSEEQIKDLNTQITAAGIARETAKAYLDEVERAFAAGITGGAFSALTSDALVALRSQLTDATAAEARARSVFGDRHPNLVSAVDTRRVLENALREELSRMRERARLDYRSAQQQEESLFVRLQQQQSRQGDVNDASVKLTELSQDAAADRQIYQLFLTRAKEAREQVTLPSNTVRIISVAKPSTKPSEPKLLIVLVSSVFLGVMVGFALAWILHVLNGSRKVNLSMPHITNPFARTDKPLRRSAEQPAFAQGDLSYPAYAAPSQKQEVSSAERGARDNHVPVTPVYAPNTYRPAKNTRVAARLVRRDSYQPRAIRR